jgi:hypothetical protein
MAGAIDQQVTNRITFQHVARTAKDSVGLSMSFRKL